MFKHIVIVLLLFFVGEARIMAKKYSLTEYRKKRQFTITPEPKGKKIKPKKKRIFVIQKHDAHSLHYDVRLEIDGVLVSWAVPKGPSLNPSIKHLAVMTEDHPMAYAGFEGVIPEGQYGAGPVMVWDFGTYRNLREKNGKPLAMSKCVDEGMIEVFLEGKKLQGAFALIKTHYQGRKDQWILVKMKDEYANRKKNPVSSQKNSALTGRTMAQIRKAG